MQAVIMAGGKGTRLSEVTKNLIPKPMVEFCGKPLIEHILLQLIKYKIKDILICVGYLGEQISDYLGNGSQYGATIHYIREDIPLGTAGSLYYAKEYITEEFLLVYADLAFDFDISRMLMFHQSNHADATLFVHPNSHPYDSDLVVCDEEDRIIRFDYKDVSRDSDYENCVNAGIILFSPTVLAYFKEPKKTALEKGIIAELLHDQRYVYAYRSPEYVKDIGTPDRLQVAEGEYLSGKIARRNLTHKQKAVFIDRDGTLNCFNGLITSPDQMILIPHVAEALHKLNTSEYLLLVVTNQPVIARGDCTEHDVDAIHKRLYTLLGNQGVFVDDLLYCPHHTDKGFVGERVELKFDCDCRKPKTGMIDQFAKKYNIDLSASWMIGDTYRDIQTGVNAGLKTILIPSDADPEQQRFNTTADYTVKTLIDAVKIVLTSREAEGV